MGSKLMLIGTAKNIQTHTKQNTVSFVISTGPAVKNAPKGLKLYGQTRYMVECSARQWRRARFSEDDDSDLVIEGFLEPRRENNKTFIAVGAMAIQSQRLQKERKLKQLNEALVQGKADFAQARQAGKGQVEVEKLAAHLLKVSENIKRFRAKNPGLSGD